MYDDYKTAHEIPCPRCRMPLRGWQGKKGPCALLNYRQGEPMPDMDLDGENVDPLPDGFTIYTECSQAGCRHWVVATGVVSNGRWVGLVDIH